MGVPAVALVEAAAAVLAVPNAQSHSLMMRRVHNARVMHSHSHPRIESSIRHSARARACVRAGGRMGVARACMWPCPTATRARAASKLAEDRAQQQQQQQQQPQKQDARDDPAVGSEATAHAARHGVRGHAWRMQLQRCGGAARGAAAGVRVCKQDAPRRAATSWPRACPATFSRARPCRWCPGRPPAPRRCSCRACSRSTPGPRPHHCRRRSTAWETAGSTWLPSAEVSLFAVRGSEVTAPGTVTGTMTVA